MTPEERENEKTKVLANYLNGIAIAMVTAGVFGPIFSYAYGLLHDVPLEPVLLSAIACFLYSVALNWVARLILEAAPMTQFLTNPYVVAVGVPTIGFLVAVGTALFFSGLSGRYLIGHEATHHMFRQKPDGAKPLRGDDIALNARASFDSTFDKAAADKIEAAFSEFIIHTDPAHIAEIRRKLDEIVHQAEIKARS